MGVAVAALIRLVLKAPLIVVLALLATTVALGVFTARNVSINTDATDMLSPELDFRKNFDAYRRAFLYLSHHGAATCTEAEPHCPICPVLKDCPEGRARV